MSTFRKILFAQRIKSSGGGGGGGGGDITSNLILRYAFEENTANTTVTDSSGNGHTGTATTNTNVLHTTGKIGTGAFLFDGSSQGVDSGYIWSITDSDITFAAWIKFTTISDNVSIISNYNGFTAILQFGISVVGAFVTQLYDSTANNIGAQTSSLLNDGVWHHIAATWKQSTTTLQLYLDGVADASSSNAGINGVWNTNNNGSIWIGKNNSSNGYFPGSIDEVRFYNRTLVPADITALYNFT